MYIAILEMITAVSNVCIIVFIRYRISPRCKVPILEDNSNETHNIMHIAENNKCIVPFIGRTVNFDF